MMTAEERAAWLEERKSGIGGSDAAAILGLSPWSTPVTIWLDKTGRSAPKEETEAMRIGTELEDFVARRYAQDTGRTVQRYNKMVHAAGCLLGNFDRLVVRDGEKVASHMGEVRTNLLLECKTSSREWEDGVPLYYQTQVQHYMGLVPCLESADVACLFLGGKKHFEVYRVERDQAVIDHMQSYLREWWERHIVRDEMPQPTCEDDCRILWARSAAGKQDVATEATIARLAAYREIKAKIDALKEEQSSAQSDILAAIGDAEVLVDSTGRALATWKSAKDSSVVDWEAVARAAGATDELIARHTATKAGARRFVVKK